MKIIGLEDNKTSNKNTIKLNRKRVAITVLVSILVLALIIIYIIYSTNQDFRNIIDKYVLMKNIAEDSTNSIMLDEGETNTIYAYDNYICVLSKNTLTNYNSSGKKDGEVKLEISNPIMESNGKYLLIGEKEKSRAYLVSGNNIVWEKDLEGNIDKMCVNRNGYVAIVLSGTTHKSVIQTFDNSGNELFKTYLSSTIVMDVDISKDNQYLAFAEVNTSGTVAQSIIKTVSIQKAKQEEEDSITYKYTDESGNLIINIKYQDGNRLLCMYDDGIYVIRNESNDKIVDFNEESTKISFADIELSNESYRVVEKSSVLNKKTNVEIISSSNQKVSTYSFDGVAKKTYSYDDCIALNIGSEVHFISTNGWLIKKYISNQDVRDVVLNNSFAGIVYRNKIDIVNI